MRKGQVPRPKIANPIRGSLCDPAGDTMGIGNDAGRAPVMLGGKQQGAMSRGGTSKSTVKRSLRPKI